MSSATSIDSSAEAPGELDARSKSAGAKRVRGTRDAKPTAPAAEKPVSDTGLRPWQFFVLAGMLSATAVVIIATGQSPAAIILLSLTVVATSLVALGFYRALAPLAAPDRAESPQAIAGRTRAALEREKTLVLRSIKELEFDFAMGKIAKGDFDEMVGRLRARAIGLMRQLDNASGYRSDIERELQLRLSRASKGSRVTAVEPSKPVEDFRASAIGESIDAEGAEETVAPDAVAEERVCEACNTTNDPDARFCKNCGNGLVPQSA